MARRSSEKTDRYIELFRKGRAECARMTENEQNEKMDELIRLYRAGGLNLLAVYPAALLVAGERSEEYLRSRIPLQDRCAFYEDCVSTRGLKGNEHLFRKALLGDAA